MSFNTLSPVLLLIGSPTQTQQETIRLMQHALCPHNSCGVCRTCRSLAIQEHARLWWLHPAQEHYTRQDLNPLFALLALQQDISEPFFIVIPHADTLSTSCANSMLKALEEPPRPYQFILTAQTSDMVLPTIVSRASIRYCASQQIEGAHPLTVLLLDASCSHAKFLQALTQQEISEQLCNRILEEVLLATTQEPRLANYYQLMQELHRHQLMPGSGPLALKTLFVLLH